MAKELAIKNPADEKERELFYKEVVNVMSQYNKIIKKPEKKLKNGFRSSLIAGVICIFVCAVLFAYLFLFVHDKGYTVLFSVGGGIYFLFAITYFYAFFTRKKLLNSLLAQPPGSQFIIDENGVELTKNSNTVKLSWDNIAFVRKYDKAVCFVGDSSTRFVISVYAGYFDEIKDEIKGKLYE